MGLVEALFRPECAPFKTQATRAVMAFGDGSYGGRAAFATAGVLWHDSAERDQDFESVVLFVVKTSGACEPAY
jgi:hypothetical protein